MAKSNKAVKESKPVQEQPKEALKVVPAVEPEASQASENGAGQQPAQPEAPKAVDAVQESSAQKRARLGSHPQGFQYEKGKK
jgi:hypothetical protein